MPNTPSGPQPRAAMTGPVPRLGVVGLPATFVRDRDGTVGYQRTGRSTAASLSGRLDGLLAAGGRWPG